MKPLFIFYFILSGLLLSGCKSKIKSKKTINKPNLKALIIDGENSHGIWPKSTFMMKSYLEETGLFEVDIARKRFTWIGPHHNGIEETNDINDLLVIYPLNDDVDREAQNEPKHDPDFNPNFSKYDVVINNLGWKSSELPATTKANFDDYIKNGGGLVVVHGANNAWGQWEAYNNMIGLGAWGGRDVESGPYVFYNTKGDEQRDTSKGICGSHGKQHEFQIQTRALAHPIMKGLPKVWLHTKDELYERMRGPAKNMTILATAYSDSTGNALINKKNKRTGRHEPILMAIDYGKGRVFHSTLGHMDYSMESVGFITTFQRGAEWAATGRVTQNIPDDFPEENQSRSRKWTLNK